MRGATGAFLFAGAVLIESGCGTATDRTPFVKRPDSIGAIAVDPGWASSGLYLQRVVDTVQKQWDDYLITNRVSPPAGSTVRVSFRMDCDGSVSKILDVESGSDDAGKQACVMAVTFKSPYGKWSPEMVAALGESQKISLTFYYQ